MEESVLTERLMQFGLTRQEALIYICLIQNCELSGYEVAKQTGISRSNVYSTLSGLVDKGAAYLLEGSTNKYTAVLVEEFCDNKLRSLQQLKDELVKCIQIPDQSSEGYVTISGYKHILDKVYHMLQNAKERIYLSAPANFIMGFSKEINQLVDQKIKVVLITDKQIEQEGVICYLANHKEAQLRFIVDSEYVLTGDITGDISDSCLYCAQKNFVNVFKEALRNEIKLIEITGGNESNE